MSWWGRECYGRCCWRRVKASMAGCVVHSLLVLAPQTALLVKADGVGEAGCLKAREVL